MTGHLLFIFLDGVGIGPDDPSINPFLAAPTPTLRALAGGIWPTLADHDARRSSPAASLAPADATLGVAGLPQSGTGTSSLLTGVNVAALLGRHTGPYPPLQAQPLLAERGLFAEVARRMGVGSVALANAYPPSFFERLARGSPRRTTTLQAAMAAGVLLRGTEHLLTGAALSADITSGWWHQASPEVPLVPTREAGHRLARLAAEHTLTVFEFFRTDHLGHRPDMAAAHTILAQVDGLVAGAIELLDPNNALLVLASDHGNCEDLSTSKHTRNPVPIVLWGTGQSDIAASIGSLTDVTPALLAWLDRSLSS